MQHKTIYRTNDPAGGEAYVLLLTVDGVSYPVTSDTRLIVDGREYVAVRSQLEIVTGEPGPGSVATGTVVATITVVPDDRT